MSPDGFSATKSLVTCKEMNRLGLMSVICITIYKYTNRNNISMAYSRLRDMWVNSYENDYICKVGDKSDDPSKLSFIVK